MGLYLLKNAEGADSELCKAGFEKWPSMNGIRY